MSSDVATVRLWASRERTGARRLHDQQCMNLEHRTFSESCSDDRVKGKATWKQAWAERPHPTRELIGQADAHFGKASTVAVNEWGLQCFVIWYRP
jgi:hypothetical protein